MIPWPGSITTPEPVARIWRLVGRSRVLLARWARWPLLGEEFAAPFAPPLMVILTTAGVICLRSGASEDVPLACSSIGSGTLALALTSAAVTARPNAAIPSSSLMTLIFHWGSAQKFFRLLGQKAGRPLGPASACSRLRLLLPPSPVPAQLKADVEVRIGADISAGGVVHIGVYVVIRGDVVGLRGSQCAGSGGEDDGQSECGLGEHGSLLIVSR